MAIQDTSAQAPGGERSGPLHDGEDFGEIKDTLQRSAHGLSTELKRESRRLMQDATQSATALANEKKSVAADYLRAVGEAAQASCQVLEQRGYAGSSKFLTHAVEGLAEFTDDLATREPTELLDDAVKYARRNPALFLGAALFAGFGLARLVQASAAADESSDEDDDMMDDDFGDDAYDYAPEDTADAT